ncbi:MAG: endonuclease/exonuclease/phosphatase family protein [Pseudomonadota bacterium]|nr:endonuclease/exonuclease/phosphatase family protein [Pseudomonadota bacterium]
MTQGQTTATDSQSPVDRPLKRLRVLSYNIQVGIPYSHYRHYLTRSWKHFLPFHGRRSNLDNIADFVSDFDIVGIQELDAGSIRSSQINQAQYLASRAGFPHWFAQTNRDLGLFAQHSLGMLSSVRPAAIMGHKLPGRIPGRGAMVTTFGEGSHTLTVVIMHLALSRRARAQQLSYIAQHVRKQEHVILMGDLNCRIDDEEFQSLLSATHLCSPEQEHHTYPSWRPRLGLDHILVTPGMHVEQSRTYHEAGFSDHLPISVDINLPATLKLRRESLAQ